MDGVHGDLFTGRTLHRIGTPALRGFLPAGRCLQRVGRATGRTISTKRAHPLHRCAHRSSHRDHRRALRGLGAFERRHMRRPMVGLCAVRRSAARVDRLRAHRIRVHSWRGSSLARLRGVEAQSGGGAPFDPHWRRRGSIGRSRSRALGDSGPFLRRSSPGAKSALRSRRQPSPLRIGTTPSFFDTSAFFVSDSPRKLRGAGARSAWAAQRPGTRCWTALLRLRSDDATAAASRT